MTIKVDYIDHMGSDLKVVNCARVSFNKEHTTLTDGDKKLIKFLATNSHEIPFAHCSVSFKVEAPLFVLRQLYKHKIGFVESELSRRYVKDDISFYQPEVLRQGSVNIKQGSLDTPVYDQYSLLDMMYEHNHRSVYLYDQLIESGVAAEQARIVLPQSMMTKCVWTGSLLAFARAYKLRSKTDAQRETKQVVTLIGSKMGELFPVSWSELCSKQ